MENGKYYTGSLLTEIIAHRNRKAMESSMKEQEEVLILAIESSCDETAAAVVKNGRTVLSNIINSQIDIHTLYGGVVPEIASRKHIENINPVINMAVKRGERNIGWNITAIAVTYGPGLVGALLVGVAEAKAIAFAKNKPTYGSTSYRMGIYQPIILEHPEWNLHLLHLLYQEDIHIL